VFLEYVVAAYAVFKVKVIDEQNVVAFLKKAQSMYMKDMRKTTINDAKFTPLPVGHYPVLVIVQKSPMWRENELQRIRKEADEVKQHVDLCDQIDRDTARIERQRHKWVQERNMLREVEEEQMREVRRMQRQTMHFEARKDRRAIEERRKQMVERKIAELAKIGEWRTDCERVRAEMDQAVEVTRETWRNWLTLREEAAELEKDEIDTELELIRAKDQAHTEELDIHAKAKDHTTTEEKRLLAEALAANEKLQSESTARRELLEQARARQGEAFRAYQEKG
jgi:hypothetical protein